MSGQHDDTEASSLSYTAPRHYKKCSANTKCAITIEIARVILHCLACNRTFNLPRYRLPSFDAHWSQLVQDYGPE